MELLFRFDKPRPFQDQMIRDIYNALEKNSSILINAPTGIGKTDASISAALSFAIKNDLSVFFLTPKISQHRIALECLKGTRSRFGNFSEDISYIDLVGKQNLCVNEEINNIDSGAFYRSCDTKVKNGSCRFFSRAKEINESDSTDQEIIEKSSNGHNELFGYCSSKGLCAYEISAGIAKRSRVIIADYSHILNPNIRSAFLRKISHTLNNSIVIWDEAHNIINAANSYFSCTMSLKGIENAKSEIESIGSKIDLDYLEFAIKSIVEKRLKDKKESFADKTDIPDGISHNIDSIIRDMENAGLRYSEEKQAKRSSILHIVRFLSLWFDDDESIARIVTKEGGIPKLMISCLYPHKSIRVFSEAKANIFMSATLLPLEMYADLFGLKEAELKNYRSPFPRSNRIAFIDNSITTRYNRRSNEMYKRIAENIIRIKESFTGNMAVFFPSFELIKSVQRNMPEGTSIYIQREGMKSISIEKILKDFKSSTNSIIFGVAGGSLSEGIDYANNIIKCVVVVGIPLAKPNLETRARIDHLDRKFNGKGNDYAYIIPALMRSVQAAGRAIRSEDDRAAIVFMDERYSWPSYYSIINNIVQISKSPDYLVNIRDFFSDILAITTRK